MCCRHPSQLIFPSCSCFHPGLTVCTHHFHPLPLLSLLAVLPPCRLRVSVATLMSVLIRLHILFVCLCSGHDLMQVLFALGVSTLPHSLTPSFMPLMFPVPALSTTSPSMLGQAALDPLDCIEIFDRVHHFFTLLLLLAATSSYTYATYACRHCVARLIVATITLHVCSALHALLCAHE